MQDLIVLSHEDYLSLKCELKEVGLDVCYTAQSVRPIRMRWSPERVYDTALLQQVAKRRPADASFRLASIQCTTPSSWLWPAQLTVTFHAVSPRQDAAFQQYLATHQLARSTARASEPLLETAQAHATPATYLAVALMLALLTAFEVAMLALPEGLRPPRWTLILVLMLFSALKFGIVLAFFMHLRYDHPLYIGLFVGGLIISAGTIVALLVLFREAPLARAAVPGPFVITDTADAVGLRKIP